MKTADDWIRDSEPYDEKTLVEWIKAIQDDAHSEGMTKAAEIVGLLAFYDEGMPKIVQSILEARDNKAVLK